MITRPVAVARSLIVAGVIWGVGALVVVTLFGLFGASATIDLGGQHDRVQVVWLGAHAFVACLASLVGVTLGASALTRAGVADRAPAVTLVGLATLAPTAATALVWSAVVDLSGSTLLALLVGLAIGTAGATIFVSHSDHDADLPYGRPATRGAGRSWSSR